MTLCQTLHQLSQSCMARPPFNWLQVHTHILNSQRLVWLAQCYITTVLYLAGACSSIPPPARVHYTQRQHRYSAAPLWVSAYIPTTPTLRRIILSAGASSRYSSRLRRGTATNLWGSYVLNWRWKITESNDRGRTQINQVSLLQINL